MVPCCNIRHHDTSVLIHTPLLSTVTRNIETVRMPTRYQPTDTRDLFELYWLSTKPGKARLLGRGSCLENRRPSVADDVAAQDSCPSLPHDCGPTSVDRGRPPFRGTQVYSDLIAIVAVLMFPAFSHLPRSLVAFRFGIPSAYAWLGAWHSHLNAKLQT